MINQKKLEWPTTMILHLTRYVINLLIQTLSIFLDELVIFCAYYYFCIFQYMIVDVWFLITSTLLLTQNIFQHFLFQIILQLVKIVFKNAGEDSFDAILKMDLFGFSLFFYFLCIFCIRPTFFFYMSNLYYIFPIFSI